ncbi:glycosyltransferase, partial [Alphaproteobacteria bacterium]|nr:glycosyltransferase [Alphaproteobacteria bacterium]
MEILVFSHVPSFPRNQGNRQRIFEITNYFKKLGCIIHFAYFPREWSGRYVKTEIIEMQNNWDFVDVIAPSKKLTYKPIGDEFRIDEWWDEAIENYIKLKLSGIKFDACIVNYAFFSKLFECLPPNVIKILDTHDRLSNRKELLEKQGLESDFFFTSREEETKGLNRSDIVLSISKDEADYFRKNTTSTVLWLGHKHSKIQARPTKKSRIKKPIKEKIKFGFIGSRNQVNTKSILDFVAFASKKWGKTAPNLEIIVAGKCSEALENFQDAPWLTLIGHVNNIELFYESLDCIIIPLFFGTGQKIKTVEALCYEVPILSSKHAFGGIRSSFEIHNLNSLADFIFQIEKISNEPKTLLEMKQHSNKILTSYNDTIKKVENLFYEFLFNNKYQ